VLSRVCAVWLVTLILLPFSAPFSTCDASSPFASYEQSDDAAGAYFLDDSLTDPGTSHALPAGRAVERAKSAPTAFSASAGIVSLPVRTRIPGSSSALSGVTALAVPLRI
jgi:hypothetical protein